MTAAAYTSLTSKNVKPSRLDSFKQLFCACALMTALTTGTAAPKLTTDSPLGFFTNLASRLLASQLNVDLTRIQVYPTNDYTSAVHRLLQVTANIYEGTTTNLYPCIYRPFFISDGTNVFINGYELVNGPDNEPTPVAFLEIPRDLDEPTDRASIGTIPTSRNFYGIPWVIGAKKGFPNLNQIAIQSVSQISRKLQLTRPLTRNGWNGYSAKQMFIIGISNNLGVELWNSYQTKYPRPLYIQADGRITVTLANQIGFTTGPLNYAIGGPASGATNLAADELDGSGLQRGLLTKPKRMSFIVPLVTNIIAVPTSFYVANTLYPVALNDGNLFWNSIPSNDLRTPQWELDLAVNLRCIVFDGGVGGRVVDYVQLNGMEASRALDQEIMYKANALGVWTTNMTTAFWGGLPEGVARQISISMGAPGISETDWANQGLDPRTKDQQISYFADFMTRPTVESNRTQVPFTPTAKIRQLIKWEANDPLVHYLTDDLQNFGATNEYVYPPNRAMTSVTNGFWTLNRSYAPWGGSLFSPWDYSNFATALKDVGVMLSDDWQFPTNQSLDFQWIGRVHRGTPWQTIYLKSLHTDPMAWLAWTGAADLCTAARMAPTNDWRLVNLLNALTHTNDHRLSVNEPDTNAWRSLLDGFTVLTNASGQLTSVVISSNSAQAAFIANAISQKRAAQTGGFFHSVADILAAPELSENSPFLDTNDLATFEAGGLTDGAFERIPIQLLPLLSLESLGSISFTGGQFVVRFTGDNDFAYAVESSSNLVEWSTVSTNVPWNGVFDFTDTSPTTNQRFYRSVLLP